MTKTSTVERPAAGTRFGRWIVTDIPLLRRYLVMCRCDCGTEKFIPCYRLLAGKSKSCGCSAAASRKLSLLKKPFIVKRDKWMVEFKGATIRLADACRQSNVSYPSVCSRVRQKFFTHQEAFDYYLDKIKK